MQSEDALSSADPVDFGAQSDLIGAPERMSIETVLTAPNGGYCSAGEGPGRSQNATHRVGEFQRAGRRIAQ
jgi:hypothetical protein